MSSHKLSNTRLYRIYQGMKQRCYNPDTQQYKNYGGKGIRICEQWIASDGLEQFYNWSILNGYSDKLEIDRINPEENYTPDNCRWITKSLNSARVSKPNITQKEIDSRDSNNSMQVRRIRKEKGISIPKLSELTGIHRRTIEDIEKNDNCTVANAIKLADALNVTLDELCRDIKGEG